MNEVIRPMNYRKIKILLEQIDRAESAKKIILETGRALTTNYDSLVKLGFSDKYISRLKNRKADGKTDAYFFSTATLDNMLGRFRHELREVVMNSINSKELTNSDVQITSVSTLVAPSQEVDYFS